MRVFLSGILLFLSTSLPQMAKPNLIDWQVDRKLTWADFQALPAKDSPNAALTNTMITVELGYTRDTFTYHIHCQFDKNKSWVKIKNPYILSHEQGHFDISEIFARKFNKELKTQKIHSAHFKNEFNKIYEQIMRAQHARQLDYDAQSDYSINKSKQEDWLRKIAEELKELGPYAHYR